MRKALVVAVILTTAALAASQTKRSNVEQMIIQMEREWTNAYVKRDVATLDRILTSLRDQSTTDPGEVAPLLGLRRILHRPAILGIGIHYWQLPIIQVQVYP
ncbi:MAG: hypothetical protein ACREA9_12005 [Pyrinomonadaceae bacterium]